jgi:hypothetical protein
MGSLSDTAALFDIQNFIPKKPCVFASSRLGVKIRRPNVSLGGFLPPEVKRFDGSFLFAQNNVKGLL